MFSFFFYCFVGLFLYKNNSSWKMSPKFNAMVFKFSQVYKGKTSIFHSFELCLFFNSGNKTLTECLLFFLFKDLHS